MSVELLLLERENPDDLAVYVAAIARARLDVVVRAASSLDEALAQCANAQALAAKAHDIPGDLIAAMPKLRWIQALTTGVDHLATLRLPAAVLVTTARGAHGPQMSELAFLYMIALSRDFARMQRNQQARIWQRWPQRLLFQKTAVIVGVGAIAEDLAKRCKAFGMTVIGVSAHRTAAPGFDAIEPRERLADAARRADFLIALAPYAPENHHLIDRKVLAALGPESVLINIARGKVVDEEALIEAVREKRIRGAGLDVFETEPPPPESPLWRCDRIIMTPRIGGMSDVYAVQASAILTENLALFNDGRIESMRNLTRI